MSEGKQLGHASGDAVKVALDKIRDQSRRSTEQISIPVDKSMSFSSTKDEEAPLVQNDELDIPTRLGNPTAEYELESEDQYPKDTRTSNFATMMHLLKGNIGTGILAMPYAVSNAGLLVGTLGIPLLGVLCVHCMHLLVNSSKKLAIRLGRVSLDYSTTAEMAFAHGPQGVQPFAKYARCAVNFMLMLTQFGFCCVYFLFVGKSIEEVVHSITGKDPIDFKWYMTMLLPAMIAMNFIKTLKNLSPASSIANVLQISGLCMVFYYLVTDLPSTDSVPATASYNKLPLYFGTAMYAFEGIGVVLPLENSMATPDDFRGMTGVLNTGMVIVTCLYTGVGFYGYLKYGSRVKGSITFNIQVPVVGEVIRLMFAAAIFLSYPLQLYVPLQIFWPYIQEKFNIGKYTAKKQFLFNLLLRVVLVIFTFILSVAIPLLPLFISLVGALASSSLALIFPPIIELMTIWNSYKRRKMLYVILVKNLLIMLIGIVGCVLGTYISIKEIANCLSNSSLEC